MSDFASQSWRWTLRETLVVAVFGAAFAVLYLAWVQVWLVSQAAFGPVTMDVFMGFWFSRIHRCRRSHTQTRCCPDGRGAGGRD